MGDWLDIAAANDDGPFLVCAVSWLNSDVGMRDDMGDWYSPIDGSEFSPAPTHYMALPDVVA